MGRQLLHGFTSKGCHSRCGGQLFLGKLRHFEILLRFRSGTSPTTEAPPRLCSRRGRISECAWHPRMPALPLQTQRNASSFWVMLLLVYGRCNYRMTDKMANGNCRMSAFAVALGGKADMTFCTAYVGL